MTRGARRVGLWGVRQKPARAGEKRRRRGDLRESIWGDVSCEGFVCGKCHGTVRGRRLRVRAVRALNAISLCALRGLDGASGVCVSGGSSVCLVEQFFPVLSPA